MKTIKSKVTLVMIFLLISVLAFSFSGCTQRIAEKMVEKAIENAAAKEGENVDVNLKEGEFKLKDKEGNELSFGGSEIPSDWPSEVPINKDIKVQFTGKNTTDGKQNWTVSGAYNGDSTKLYEYYKSEFSSWTQDMDSSASAEGGQKTYYYQVSNDKYVVSLVIGEKTDEGVAVILTVNEK